MAGERRDFVLPFELDSSDNEMETDEEGEEEPTRMTADSTSICPSFPVSDPNDRPCDTTSVFYVDDRDDDMWSIETFVLADGDPDQSHWHHSTHPDSPGPIGDTV
ncbi:unnamed protein product [Acanthoscelides obtectus]|uniref:Uncharacterized protein n=1 Tax=Acanthoscelides obtectus TaxID=200917 RepID=A0A9P0LKK4_ACAOB|nr:unnamed protein product [Acanthoscelides obtectus]CAK1632686.1 hypothetical protein AOBTE_LOCUS7676 [Acanthoscelides obtectus]